MCRKTLLSYDAAYDDGFQAAYEQWRHTLMPGDLIAYLKTPKQFEAVGAHIGKEAVEQKVKVSHRLEVFVDCIRQLAELGFGMINLHNVNRTQQPFVREFGRVRSA